MSSDFDGLNVVVTGSGSGIGLELCQQLNSFGARVFGLDLSAGELGDSGTWISCDVGSTASVKKAFEEDTEIVIEEVVEGLEVTCGLFKSKANF